MFDDLFEGNNMESGKCGECEHIAQQNKPAIVPNRYCPVIKKYVHMEQFGCMEFKSNV
jgi:hypothetical protein